MATNEHAADYEYVGDELDVFAHAVTWKSYFRSRIAPYISGDVLEVGAGFGTTTRVLCDGSQKSWTCLEPDPRLLGRLEDAAKREPFSLPVTMLKGTLADVDQSLRFDTLLYIDVLEHIEDDKAELARASQYLKPGGTLVVLCPAHQALYTTFDKMIGHYRRYNKSLFRALQPPGMTLDKLFYLDSVGLLLSVGNRLLLRSGSPTVAQVKLWDRCFVRASRLLDPLLAYHIGRSVIGIWRKASSLI